jgi:hypothetical protein
MKGFFYGDPGVRKEDIAKSLQKDKRNEPKPASRAYHRFFEGYSEIKVDKPMGKGSKIKRIYTGNFFRQDLSKKKRFLAKAVHAILYLLAVGLFMLNAIFPLKSNTAWYTVLPAAMSILFLFWAAIALFSYIPAKKEMTIAEYRFSSLYLKKAALGSSICLSAAALSTIAFIMLNPCEQILQEIIYGMKYMAAGLLMMAVYRIEEKIQYLEVPSKNTSPENSVEIS